MQELTIPARLDRFGELLEFIGAATQAAGLDLKNQNNINIAVEEIFVNIASYAYPDGEGVVTVRISFEADTFTAEFKDSGMFYNPLGKADPDTYLSAGEREIGGLGIFMVKKIMDEVSYEYKNGQNILTIRKG